jgi:hypothetical protein
MNTQLATGTVTPAVEEYQQPPHLGDAPAPLVVFGLLSHGAAGGDAALRSSLRALTIAWSRYGYSGPVIEAQTINAVLDRALEAQHRFCFIQAPGTIISEIWFPAWWNRKDLHAHLADLMADGEFLATGRIVTADDGSQALDARCLLVSLEAYAASGRPTFAISHVQGIPVARLVYSAELARARFGVREFDPAILDRMVQLVPGCDGAENGLSRFLGDGIERFVKAPESELAGMTASQRVFLNGIASQAMNARRGVFPWNLETYADITTPPGGFESPVSHLYSVAAGFKPYRILLTHGFSGDTRVVYFDYSTKALEFRKLLLDEWDGEDYPRFLRFAFGRMPPPETFYQLWAGLTPDELDATDMDAAWRAETERWGGEPAFREHWRACRGLTHEFVRCNILTEQSSLLERVRSERSSVIWWSNAFFTMYSNWSYSIEDRRKFYRQWIDALAMKCPDISVYGSDNNNISVNAIRAGEYANLLQQDPGCELAPRKYQRIQIRS